MENPASENSPQENSVNVDVAANPAEAAVPAGEPKKHDYKKHEFRPKHESNEEKRNFFLHHYDKSYKKLLIIPAVIIIVSIAFLFYSQSSTGEFFQKDVSIKGGVIVTILHNYGDVSGLAQFLSSSTGSGVSVRRLSESGTSSGIVVEAGIQDDAGVENLLLLIQQKTGELAKDEYSAQVIGSALGSSFFSQMVKSIGIAFMFMAIAVFFYFRLAAGKWIMVPSAFVIWTVAVDMLCTLAVISFLKVEVSTAGLAALLLLIGYSVDTDILLTMKMLKGRESTLFDKIMSAAKTGIFMTLTGMAAVAAGFLFSQSDTIKQIMLILLIGLAFDIIHTWITNTAILRWYMERNIYGSK